MGKMRPGVSSMGARPWDRGKRGWWVRVYANGAEEKYRVGPSGPEGEEAARKVCEAIDRRNTRGALWSSGSSSRPLPSDETLRGWIEVYGPLRSERTQLTDRGRVEHLAAFFGATDLRDLTDGSVRRFANQLLTTKSGHTVAGCLSTLRRVLNLAVRERLLPANPVPTINDMIKAAKAATATEVDTRAAWTREEWVQIWALAEKHETTLAPALFFAIHTGARRGEIIALRWEDIDFDRKKIHFRRAARLRKGTKVLKNSTMTRHTPMSPELEARLRLHLEERHREQLKGRPAPEWVFPSPRGLYWTERNFTRAWERLRRRFAKKGVRPLKFHCTRHTFITWALEAGKPVKRVSEWVGATAEVIHKHYSHVLNDDDTIDFMGAVPTAPEPHQTAPIKESSSTDEREHSEVIERNGDPGAIRTRDPQLRRLVLYPAELPGHSWRNAWWDILDSNQ
jgi:integrase